MSYTESNMRPNFQQLWDYYYLVMGTIEFWKKSPWKKIDADGMDQECKRFTKDMRQLDKDMRVWYDKRSLYPLSSI